MHRLMAMGMYCLVLLSAPVRAADPPVSPLPQDTSAGLRFVALTPLPAGVELALACPSGSTNRFDIFVCTNLAHHCWRLAATRQPAPDGTLAWTDTSAPTNASAAFYFAGLADCTAESDPDGDGLAWARERCLYRTSPTLNDSDGDGLCDGVEILERNTDPTNGDTNAPAITITTPPHGVRWIWIP